MNATFLSPLVGAIPVSAESTATIPATVFPAGSGNMETPALLSAGDDPTSLTDLEVSILKRSGWELIRSQSVRGLARIAIADVLWQ
jgi:hypothetical protein